MQPTYLPWSGYFYLASKVDTFVFLDDVQFERRSWQSRNKILINGRESLLNVPVQYAPRQALIYDIRLSQDFSWQKKHLRSIQVAYPALWRDASLKDPLMAIYERPYQFLADFNIDLIDLLFGWLGLKCRTLRASALACGGTRSQHLAEICRVVEADTYFSPLGSREYLEEDQFEKFSGLGLRYAEFTPPSYSQGSAPEFVSHLSLMDVIGHGGLEFAKAYIRKEPHHADAN
jgi:hypothetical protein